MKNKNKYELVIKICGNIDHGENPFEPPYGMSKEYKESSNEVYELQVALRDFCDENDLGAGNLESDKIYEDGKYYADVCYNGNLRKIKG